jgi:hypothetical protein
MRGLAWGPTFSPASASKVLAKEKLTDHVFCHQHPPLQHVGRAIKSISFDLGNRSATSGSSYFKIVDFEKLFENRIRRSPWDLGSRVLNMPARVLSIKKAAIFTYQSPFGKPSFTLWMMWEAARSVTVTSSGLMRTIGRARVS